MKGVEDKATGGQEIRDLKNKVNGRTMCVDRSSKGALSKSVQVSQPGVKLKELEDSDPRNACDSNRKTGGVTIL